MFWILNLIQPTKEMLQKFYFCFLIVKPTFLQNWPNVPVAGIIRLVPEEEETSHWTPIYAYLKFVGRSEPCQFSLSFIRRSSNFGFLNNPFWTGGNGTWPQVPKGSFRVFWLQPPCTTLYWRAISKTSCKPCFSHPWGPLKERCPQSLAHICNQNKNADFIFSIGTCQFI